MRTRWRDADDNNNNTSGFKLIVHSIGNFMFESIYTEISRVKNYEIVLLSAANKEDLSRLSDHST